MEMQVSNNSYYNQNPNYPTPGKTPQSEVPHANGSNGAPYAPSYPSAMNAPQFMNSAPQPPPVSHVQNQFSQMHVTNAGPGWRPPSQQPLISGPQPPPPFRPPTSLPQSGAMPFYAPAGPGAPPPPMPVLGGSGSPTSMLRPMGAPPMPPPPMGMAGPRPGFLPPGPPAPMGPPPPNMMQPPHSSAPSGYSPQAPPPPMGQLGHGQPQYPAQGMPPPPGQPQYPTQGMPPPPGQPQYPTQGMPPPPGQSQAPPSQRRLNPDLMPSAVQVQDDDRVKKGGLFNPGEQDRAPPLVTTEFYCQPSSTSCSPNFIRSTLYNVPISGDLMKQLSMQLGLTITPFAPQHEREYPLQSSDMGPQGPVRCIRCKAYMSPFMTFLDGGRRFQCCLCGGTAEVPSEYFVHLDHTGRRMDYTTRPELSSGSYEIVATHEYCRNDKLPEAPAYIFALDVSYAAVKNGLVQLWCNSLKQHILPHLPRENEDAPSAIRVGFITYDRVIHFYNLKSCLTQPQIQVVSDITDVFVPLVDGFLVSVEEASTLIDILLETIPRLYADTRCTESVFAPVVQVGMDALSAANRCGKVFIFHASSFVPDAPGKLKTQDDRKLIGTDKEKTLLQPSSTYYNELGQSCVKVGCSVDLFLFPNVFLDLATVAEVAKVTGGNIYKYHYFQPESHGESFLRDFRTAVSSPCGFDAVLRVRTSTGTRPVLFYGNFYMGNTTDVDLACLDRRTSLTCEVKHDDKLQDGEPIFIQLACLYTSVSGQRRLRVHNLQLQATANKMDVFRATDLDTLMNLYVKESIHQLQQAGKSPQDIRDLLATKCARILAAYRTHCAANSNPGELVLPEQMKLMPLYCNSLSNSDVVSFASDISTADRVYLLFLMNGAPVKESNIFIYPRLVALHSVNVEETTIPTAIRCSYERLESQGVYLLENGINLFLWFGHQVSQEFMASAFGVASPQMLDQDKVHLAPQNNPLSARIFSILEMVRAQRSRCMRTVIVRQGERTDTWFKHFLVEDRGENNAASYVDYLCHIHKEVRTLLNH